MTIDEAHVLLDGLVALERAMEDDGRTPWNEYDGDPYFDPKLTEDGYREVLAAARADLMKVIEEG